MGLVFLALAGSGWGWELALIAFLCCGAWLAGPAWLVHLSMASPEARD